jgi:minor histocompatibility antigen H13
MSLGFHLAYVVLAGLLVVTNFVVLQVDLQMLLYTTSMLYLGSHLSLKLLQRDEEGRARHGEAERVTSRDALLFPLLGSGALCSLYVAFKVFGPVMVNYLLTVYMSVMGVAALVETLRPLAGRGLGERAYGGTWALPWPLGVLTKTEKVDLRFTLLDVALTCLALPVGAGFLFTKHFTLHNLLAVSLAVQAMHYVSLSTFKVAFLLLGGLFFYDVFWVFGTDVMVTVAKNFEGPVKLLFPLALEPLKTSLLGLGDVVLPGMLVAMCLRFDSHLAGAKVEDVTRPAFPRGYFVTCMLGYALGLLVTSVVMRTFQAPQPALLYLVPSTVLSVVGRATWRGELGQLWGYSEEEGKKDE